MLSVLVIACFGKVEDTGDGSILGPATSLSHADAILVGEPLMDAGSALATGDVNGDGADDLLVGAPHMSAHGDPAGRVHVVLGPIAGDLDLGTTDALIGDGLWLGDGGLSVGDVAGLGSAQVIAGHQWQLSQASMGEVMAFSNWSGDLAFDESNAVMTIVGDIASAEGAAVLGSRDLDGDGATDLATGIHDWESAQGRVAVHFGPLTGQRFTSDADALLTSVASANQAGRSLAYAGDANGDGWEDLLVGAPGPTEGAVYVAYGPFVDATLDSEKLIGTAADANFGAGVVGIPDRDGDGIDEIALGAPGEKDAGGIHDGAVYVTHGPVEGIVTLTDPILTGEPGAGFLGFELAWGTRGCGEPALYAGGVGDYYQNHDAAGNVYAFEGASEAIAAIWHGEHALDRAGDAIVAGADLDGDGCGDLAIGASWSDRGGTSSGAVYVVHDG
jgi:hypothetical protein